MPRVHAATLAILALCGCPSTGPAGDDDAQVDDDADDTSAADDDTADDDDDTSAADDDDDDATNPEGPPSFTWQPPLGLLAPAFVAMQDGDGPWTPLAADAGSVPLEPADAEGRYAVLIACDDGASVEVQLLAATLDELPRPLLTCGLPDPSLPQASLSGEVLGLSGEEIAIVRIGPSYLPVFAGQSSYEASLPPGEAYDAFVARSPAWDSPVDRLLIHRGIEVPEGGSTLDFDLAVDGLLPVPRTVEVGGELSADGYVLVDYLSAGGTFGPVGYGAGSGAAFGEPPEESRDPEDRIFVEVGTPATSGPGDSSYSIWAFLPPGEDHTLVVPPPLDGATASAVDSAGGLRWDLSWEPWEGATLYRTRASRSDWDAGTSKAWTMVVSAGRAGDDPGWSSPDLSDLGGWNAGWSFSAGDEPSKIVAAAGRVLSEARGGMDVYNRMAAWLASIGVPPNSIAAALRGEDVLPPHIALQMHLLEFELLSTGDGDE
jgi:hypothetical protein